MRRSAAPSQSGFAKKAKFVSPASSFAAPKPAVLRPNSAEAGRVPAVSVSPISAVTPPGFGTSIDVRTDHHHVLQAQSQCKDSASQPTVRKKSDMIALLSKKSPMTLGFQDLQPPSEKAKMPLSPNKAVDSEDSNLPSLHSPLQHVTPTAAQTSQGQPNLGSTTVLTSQGRPNLAQATVIPTRIEYSQAQSDSQNSPTADVRYFSVMWCKASKKKHKKWEGDAVMSTSGRSVTLYDTEGKIIGRGSGYKVAELLSLAEDETLFVGGKEIQVMSVLSEEQFKSGKCFMSGSAPDSGNSIAAVKNSGTFKPFTNPLLKNSGSLRPTPVAEKVAAGPKYDPTADNALVMPRPNSEQQWRSNNGGGLPLVDVVVDPYLSNFLRRHQREGVVFLYSCVMGLREHGGAGAILADEMGLGKTLQCITLIWTLLKQGPYGGKPAVKKVLVITPGSLVKNWYQEFKKWLGTERLSVYAVSLDKRVEDYMKSNMYPVLLISYEMFVRCHEVIQHGGFDLIICDEGHRLKNTAIKTTNLIMSLPCRRRVVLTGTPVQNDLQEFFSIVEFCNPGILGSISAFRRVYEEPIVASRQPRASQEEKDLGKERAAELTRLTQMFVLRRTQEVNNDYLPPKVELVLFCRPSPLQVTLYKQLLLSKAVRLCLQSGRSYQQQGLSGSAHLTIIGALKQLCNHPRLIHNKASAAGAVAGEGRDVRLGGLAPLEEGQEDSIYSGLHSLFPASYRSSYININDSGKLAVLSGILSSIWKYSSTEKVVLVSNHTKNLDLLQEFCKTKSYSFLRLDGQTPVGQRQDLVNKFNKLHSHRIFLLSSKAGGVGLNLVGASRLVLYDIDWNPANDLQAMARVWRDGQRGRVYIYRLLTTGSIEEKVYQRQISKQGLSGAVMDISAHSNVKFSLEDLKDLFTLNELTDCETHAMLACPCEGDPDYVLDATKLQTENSPLQSNRLCQLGNVGAPKPKLKAQAANLTMAQLLSWKHWRGDYAKLEKTWYLEDADEALSYVFWSETNS